MNSIRPLAFALVLVAAGLTAGFDVLQPLDMIVLDRQFAYLRQHRPQSLPNDVVVVGIDEESFARLHEPFALWHPYLGKFLRAMAVARPSVLGVDIALPERSYHFLIPRYDLPLLQGLAAAKTAMPVVLAQTLDQNGHPRPIFPPYISIAGVDAFASVAVCLDTDGVVRRLRAEVAGCPNQDAGSTLAAKMAQRIEKQVQDGELIDFAVGSAFSFIPFQDVLDWFDRNQQEQLRLVFKDRPVLLGMNLPYSDRHRIPVPVLAGEPGNRRVPGVLVHAQALRSYLHHGLLRRAGTVTLVLMAGAGVLFWFGKGGWLKAVCLLLFVAGTLTLSTILLVRGTFLPVASVLFCATGTLAARIAFEGVRSLREKRFLRRSFGSYVSPEVLKEILAGRIRPGLGGLRKHVCVLFSDIRGFTARSEGMAPESVIALLNEYFSAMTASVHRHGGTVDKFIGDGMMALFGVPQTLASPERAALQAAQEMLARLEEVNQVLCQRGFEPIRIGIGIHAGEAVVGHVGSDTRHEYTAIGDVVNVASRLEGLTKEAGYPIVCSATVAAAVEGEFHLVDLGELSLKGHSRMRLYGCGERQQKAERMEARVAAAPRQEES